MAEAIDRPIFVIGCNRSKMTLEFLGKGFRRLLPDPIRKVLRPKLDAVIARAWFRLLRVEAALVGGASEQTGFRVPEGEAGHLCILCSFFPPVVTGGTYRPAALARFAADAGVRVTVVTSARPDAVTPAGEELLEDLPDTVGILDYETPALYPDPLLLPEIDGGILDALSIFFRARAATRACPPDYVFATGPYFCNFVAGYLLAKRSGSRLILDYRDEWTECPFDFVRSGPHDLKWERRCLEAADRVVFTTSSQRLHCLDVFPELTPERTAVVPNGWNPRYWSAGSYHAEPGGEPASPDPLILSYVGSLGNHTPHSCFLSTVEAALGDHPEWRSRLQLQFVGNLYGTAASDIASFTYPDLLEVQSVVPKSRASEILHASHGLLLLNEERLSRYIPGKLYEYVASGRPIVLYGTGGEMASLVERLEAGVVVPRENPDALLGALERIEGWSSDPAATERRSEWLRRHTRDALSERMMQMIRGF